MLKHAVLALPPIKVTFRGAALALPWVLAFAGVARAQDEDIDKKIRRLREDLDRRLKELDKEKDRIKGEFEKEIEKLREPRPESPTPPRRREERRSSEPPSAPVPPDFEGVLNRVFDRIEGVLQKLERRVRALEERVPELRKFHEETEKRFFKEERREEDRPPPEKRDRQFRWEFRLPWDREAPRRDFNVPWDAERFRRWLEEMPLPWGERGRDRRE